MASPPGPDVTLALDYGKGRSIGIRPERQTL